jgi:hypothetical protein
MTKGTNFIQLTGPVERIDGKLMLRIPLSAGGNLLEECTRGISVVQDDMLCIEIKDWLAQKLSLSETSVVTVDNADGKFNIHPNPPKR